MLVAADFKSFIDSVNALKGKSRSLLTNSFLDINKIMEHIQKRQSFQCLLEGSSFLLYPFHQDYYDCLFYSSGQERLRDDLRAFLAKYEQARPIRVSILGKEPLAGSHASVFRENGFNLLKRITRTILQSLPEKTADSIFQVSGSSEWPQGNNIAGEKEAEPIVPQFAVRSDAAEVLDLLLEGFDICADAIPELGTIVENIEKKQVVVVRQNNKIVALHYFEIINGICRRLYDFTRKEYRKKCIFWYISQFMPKYYATLETPITRTYGWRDTADKRLMKLMKLGDEISDGVYIYNMVWDPSERCAQKELAAND